MRQAALCTKHNKAQILRPVLLPLGYKLEEVSTFDTDTLGTFSGEVERTLTPMQAAHKKAQIACELALTRFGLGSEGSFGGGPVPGLCNWNDEVICFFDSDTERAIYAVAGGASRLSKIDADNGLQLIETLVKFPEQRWVLRENQQISKALTVDCIEKRITEGRIHFPVTLEPDLRAMYSPDRQEMIRKAALDLKRRLIATCPACKAFDFVVNKVERGLPCQACGIPTQQIKQKIKSCVVCGFECHEKLAVSHADPAKCTYCNP